MNSKVIEKVVNMKMRYKIFWGIVLVIIILTGTSSFFGGTTVEPIFRVFPAYDEWISVSGSMEGTSDSLGLGISNNDTNSFYFSGRFSQFDSVTFTMFFGPMSEAVAVHYKIDVYAATWTGLEYELGEIIKDGALDADRTSNHGGNDFVYLPLTDVGYTSNLTDYETVIFKVVTSVADGGYEGYIPFLGAVDGDIETEPDMEEYVVINGTAYDVDLQLDYEISYMYQFPLVPPTPDIEYVDVPFFDISIAWGLVQTFLYDYFPWILGVVGIGAGSIVKIVNASGKKARVESAQAGISGITEQINKFKMFKATNK
jgi:hypothetical protein